MCKDVGVLVTYLNPFLETTLARRSPFTNAFPTSLSALSSSDNDNCSMLVGMARIMLVTVSKTAVWRNRNMDTVCHNGFDAPGVCVCTRS